MKQVEDFQSPSIGLEEIYQEVGPDTRPSKFRREVQMDDNGFLGLTTDLSVK
jgi:hypothetical protein